ncbi:MAG: LacI family transcriptional regulator [Anaerolineae bacterium]|nr:LacI family transcriptional regulator [Anaerolineae bacterium]MDW8171986.1 LacI family DNA-binding transcriptional regulator [Anaerolineae bacterium]
MPPKKLAVTIRDVADLAQVSVTTVSHVINNTRYVEPNTRERVQMAIKSLNYRPNSLARSLRRRGTATIGLLVPDNSNPFFAEVARVIEDLGFERGYSVILCNSDSSEEREARYVDVLLSKQVDGLLVISAGSHPNFISSILSSHVPLVVVDRETPELQADQVLLDNEVGGALAAHYLLDLGHQRIGIIIGPNEAAPSALRFRGFCRALQERGVAWDDSRCVMGDFHYSGGEQGARKLLDAHPDLTAIFATNDLMAMGAVNQARRRGRRVPEDLSIIGFDNISQSAAFYPPLSTVAQPIEALGRHSLNLLLARIGGDDRPPQRIVLQPSLVIRESCTTPKNES